MEEMISHRKKLALKRGPINAIVGFVMLMKYVGSTRLRLRGGAEGAARRDGRPGGFSGVPPAWPLRRAKLFLVRVIKPQSKIADGFGVTPKRPAGRGCHHFNLQGITCVFGVRHRPG